MVVHDVFVNMHMRVTVCSARLLQAPREIHEAERQQRPAGEIAAYTLDSDERREWRPEQDADGADCNRPQDVRKSAIQRRPQRPAKTP